ncbi:MAG: hypothetical protein OJF51_004241 [Nitrospira sp.]|nr:MAG: hypothetical protein OJF51_004241 [Nitrospira sp.]
MRGFLGRQRSISNQSQLRNSCIPQKNQVSLSANYHLVLDEA